MPKGGHNRKPVQVQIAEGDPAKRGVHTLDRMLERQPRAQRGLPDPPRHLQGLAREQWYIWKGNLEALGLDYACDAVMLEGACINYARAIEADEILKDGCEIEEPVYDKLTGQVIGTRLQKHPAVARSNMCWKNVLSFASSLGLSLASRQRLAIESDGTGGGDDLMELLSGPRVKREPPDEPPVN